MAAISVVPSPAVTAAPLYVIEDYLAAMIETAELVAPEQEAEFTAELARALETAVEKRDRVGQFLAHLETQAAFADAEIRRLRDRKALYESTRDRLEVYVVRAIEGLGRDEKGRYPKLEGRSVSFCIRKCPASVEITDEAGIPASYKTIAVKLPAQTWEQMLDALDLEQRNAVLEQVKEPDCTCSKTLLKRELEAGVEISGARLVTDRHSLRRA